MRSAKFLHCDVTYLCVECEESAGECVEVGGGWVSE
jgi:hypothetical protein